MPESNQRLTWPDLVKGVCLILITAHHVIGGVLKAGVGGVDTSLVLDTDWDLSKAFRVAAFFFLSGFMADRSLAKHSKSYMGFGVLRTVLYPYLLWTAVQVLLMAITRSGNTAFRWQEIPVNVLFGWKEYWFLHALLQIFVLELLLRSLGAGRLFRVFLGMALVVIGTCMPPTGTYYWRNLTDNYIYFAAGALFNSYDLKVSRAWLWSLVIGGLAIHLTLHYCGARFQTPLFPIATGVGIVWFVALCMLASEGNALDWVRLLGRYSLQWFCLHVICSAGTRTILLHCGYSNLYGVFVTATAVGMVLPIILAIIDERYIKLLFRLPRKSVQAPQPSAAVTRAQADGLGEAETAGMRGA